MAEGTEQIVREVLSVVLGRPIDGDSPVLRSDTPTWDSLKHVEILFAIEDACGVSFDQDELAALESVEAIVISVEKHKTT